MVLPRGLPPADDRLNVTVDGVRVRCTTFHVISDADYRLAPWRQASDTEDTWRREHDLAVCIVSAEVHQEVGLVPFLQRRTTNLKTVPHAYDFQVILLDGY